MSKPYAGYDPTLPKSVIKISYPSGEEISIDELVKKKVDNVQQTEIISTTQKIADILARLTRKDYEILKKEFIEMTKDVSDPKLIATPIFENALLDTNFIDLYIDLIKSVSKKDVIKRLLDLCQDEFEKESPANKSLESEENEDVDEMWAKEEQYRTRRMADIVLLGELFKSNLLPAKALGSIIAALLTKCSENEIIDEKAIEEFCVLVNNVGLALSSNQEFVDDLMNRVEELSFMISDGPARDSLIELLYLYENGWQHQY